MEPACEGGVSGCPEQGPAAPPWLLAVHDCAQLHKPGGCLVGVPLSPGVCVIQRCVHQTRIGSKALDTCAL